AEWRSQWPLGAKPMLSIAASRETIARPGKNSPQARRREARDIDRQHFRRPRIVEAPPIALPGKLLVEGVVEKVLDRDENAFDGLAADAIVAAGAYAESL